ncbi:hypothetical protein [Pseudonocardia sp. NPDC049154]|uniref:hypothetical protein n=1 Tax=Pseudonocardia sp. NPDC049154 TaxID=3155501 RepID=UPI0033FBF713
MTLPAEGRQGPEPRWPLAGEPTPREAYIWRGLWKKPQAVMWEALGLEFELAIYTRRLTEVELPDASATLGTLVMRMADNLGITVPGMHSLKWKIGTAPSQAADEDDEPPSPVIDARNRFRAER